MVLPDEFLFFMHALSGSRKNLWTLQLVIREIVIQSTTTEMMELGLISLDQIMAKEALKYTSIVVSSLPL